MSTDRHASNINVKNLQRNEAFAFSSPTGFPSASRGQTFLKRPVCFPSRHGRTTRRKKLAISMNAGSGERKTLPDFDRDYYDELKAEFGHLEGVRIFSKKDYTLDPLQAPWLYDDRGRDLNQVKENMKDAPIVEGEVDDLLSRPMLVTEMHTKEEIDDFETRFRTCDAVSGRVWEDPMPESDFDRDPDWLDLRKVDDELINSVQEEPELWFEDMDKPALKRKQYASEEEETAALMDSFHQMQAEQYENFFDPVAYSEHMPVPHPDTFEKWGREADARGGNSTKFESYGLSPFNSWDTSKDPENCVREGDGEAPKQHQALVQAHLGRWYGSVSVISVRDGKQFAPKLLELFPCDSEVTQLSDESLEWTTNFEVEGDEILSSVKFSNVDCQEALIPGRAVSADGCYASRGRGSSDESDSATLLSVSSAVAQKVAQNRECHPLIEIGLLTASENGVCRTRVLLCESPTTGEGSRDKDGKRINTLIVIKETNTANTRSKAQESAGAALPLISVDKLIGKWNGTAALLQPEYPPLSCRWLKTKRDLMVKNAITENDVSFVENTIPEHPERESKRRVRTVCKKKTSKRVAAIKAYDRRRLSACNILGLQKTGENEEERFAWETMPREDEFSSLFSPRTGRFVDDYCGVLVAESVLCTFPFNRATPDMWNEITLTSLTMPSRKSITVGRNEVGDIVGALFVTEHAEDSALSDSVASYI